MEIANFSAGPAALPRPVLERAREGLGPFGTAQVPILSQSHRGPDYDRVHRRAREGIARLLGLPASHEVLLLQGGASTQFAHVPLNFLPPGRSADYVITGAWSEKALAEARRLSKVAGEARVAGTTEDQGSYRRVPGEAELDLSPDAAYVHLTSNNTIFGTQFHGFPRTESWKVADMSSDLLSRPMDVSGFGLIYAGAQKNLGPAGLTVVLGHSDWLRSGRTDLPNIVRYAVHADKDSLYHTPPTFAVYLTMLVVDWIDEQGGLEAMEAANARKQAMVYEAIDRSDGFYQNPVEAASRSWMNVVFRLPNEEIESEFLKQAEELGLHGLKGHRSVGGVRASLYNAVGIHDVERLVEHMESFRRSGA